MIIELGIAILILAVIGAVAFGFFFKETKHPIALVGFSICLIVILLYILVFGLALSEYLGNVVDSIVS